MQTYTHASIGALIGLAYFPHQPVAQLLCIGAAVAPDIVMMPTFLLDRMPGRQALTNQPRWLLATKELSHSLPLSAGMLLIGLHRNWPLLIAIGIGWLSHVIIDMLTHGNPCFQENDPHYIWPFGSLRKIGVWDYRIQTGQLWPVRPFELIILVSTSMVAVILFFTSPWS